MIILQYEGDEDKLGDLPFVLSNNDRYIIRSMILFMIERVSMDEIVLADIAEFNNRLADQFDAHKEKTS